MSTRSSIAYISNKLHYYRELLDDTLHLCIENADFDCGSNEYGSSVDVVLSEEVARTLGIAPAEPRDWNNIPPTVIDSVCLSMRHDYGLMPAEERKSFRWQVEQVIHAISKENWFQ